VGEIHAELLSGEEIHSELDSDKRSEGNTQSDNGKYEQLEAEEAIHAAEIKEVGDIKSE